MTRLSEVGEAGGMEGTIGVGPRGGIRMVARSVPVVSHAPPLAVRFHHARQTGITVTVTVTADGPRSRSTTG